jgi:glycosyltransferase involved in cell wall biosynthesis
VARILQICNTDFYLSKFLTPLIRELIASGHEVECACEGDRIDAQLTSCGVKVHQIEFPRTASLPQFWRAIAQTRKVIRTGRYDCVNSHNRNASIVGRIAAWLERTPVNLYTAHGFYFHDNQSALAKKLSVWLEGLLARITDFTFSQSAEDVEMVTRAGYIPRDRILCIGNGIDIERYKPRNERVAAELKFGLAPGMFRIVTVGRLVEGKGFGDLLEAFYRLNTERAGCSLLLIGGNIPQDISPYAQRFMADVVAKGLQDSVLVTGIVDNVQEYLYTADAFVLPSYREGMPRSLIEAMASGLPSIATNIRGCREILRHELEGFLYQPRDVAALHKLLLRLHDDSQLRTEFGRRGRVRVAEHFSESAYVARQVVGIGNLLDTKSATALKS